MKTIKCYTCDCGEDIYEDDEQCCNCLALVDPDRFKEEPIFEITQERGVRVVELDWAGREIRNDPLK